MRYFSEFPQGSAENSAPFRAALVTVRPKDSLHWTRTHFTKCGMGSGRLLLLGYLNLDAMGLWNGPASADLLDQGKDVFPRLLGLDPGQILSSEIRQLASK
jgi:hypothetical protein